VRLGHAGSDDDAGDDAQGSGGPDGGAQVEGVGDDAAVVAYCRGPYCVYADDAVRLLRRRGYRARRLEDGFPEWKRGGLPVATVRR
jgi:rhodanese-related sulfurtransferase